MCNVPFVQHSVGALEPAHVRNGATRQSTALPTSIDDIAVPVEELHSSEILSKHWWWSEL